MGYLREIGFRIQYDLEIRSLNVRYSGYENSSVRGK